MNYSELVIMFDILNSTLKIPAELLSEAEHKKYQDLLDEKKDRSFFGIAFNLKYTGSKVITMDLFKPENIALREEFKKQRFSGTRPQYDCGRYKGPVIFLNLNSIDECYKSGQAQYYLKEAIPWWSETPISIRTLVAYVLIHELTHCQDEAVKPEGCPMCFGCKHCDSFNKRVWDNWERILEDDCLRKIDFALLGIEYTPLLHEQHQL